MSRSGYTIVMHMSDFHFGGHTSSPYAVNHDTVMGAFIECYEKLIKTHPRWAPEILVVSGDVTLRGASKGYEEAEKFFRKLFSVNGNKVIKPENVIISFGNHDVDTSSVEPLPENKIVAFDRNIINTGYCYRPPNNDDSFGINHLDEKYNITPELVAKYYHRFENAENFCSRIGIVPLATRSKSPYKYAYGSRQVKGINFICLNTEWNFWGKTDKDGIAKGHLQIGASIYNDADLALPRQRSAPFARGRKPSITVFHRGLNYLHSSEQLANTMLLNNSRVGNLIYRNDIALCGHIHKKSIMKSYSHTQIFSGAMYEDRYNNGNQQKELVSFNCNLIAIPKRLNATENECKIRKFYYAENNPYDPWVLESEDDCFDIIRLSDTSKVSDCIEAVRALEIAKEEKDEGKMISSIVKIVTIFPTLGSSERTVLINHITKELFDTVLHDVVKNTTSAQRHDILKALGVHDPPGSGSKAGKSQFNANTTHGLVVPGVEKTLSLNGISSVGEGNVPLTKRPDN